MLRIDAADRARLAARRLIIDDDVKIGHDHEWRTLLIEAPAKVHGGWFSVDAIGAYTYLGGGSSQFDHVAVIGRFCAIATGVIAGPAEHPTDFLSPHPLFEGAATWTGEQAFQNANAAMIAKAQGTLYGRRTTRFGKIEIGHDVWIGEGAFIRRGVTIGNGAVVGARAVVMNDVPPYTIVAGTPARLIRYRFEPAVIDALEELAWWRYGLSALDGVDFTDVPAAITTIERNIASGRAQPFQPPMLCLVRDEAPTLADIDATTGALVRQPLA